MDTYLEKAIHAAGGVSALARSVNVSSQAISQWGICPTDRVLAVCKAGDWVVTPHQLRPDIYPYPQDALPLEMRKCA